jgi:hypothetical protein
MAIRLDYIDLTAKILIPVSIFVATMAYNGQQSHQHEVETCVDLQLKLFGAVCVDKDCAVSPSRAELLTGLKQLINDQCPNLKQDKVDAVLKKSALYTTDVSAAAELGRAAGQSPTSVTGPAVTPLTQQAQAAAPVAGTLEVYVQIADASQEDPAKALISRLGASTLGPRAIVARGPELVRNVAVARTEVRCAKEADCPAARDLAAYLGGLLGTPVAVRDISPTYQNNPKAKPGVLELWFAPGPILTVAPAPKRVFDPTTIADAPAIRDPRT